MPLTKVRRGGTDTGIADASDATAITIDSSESVGIKNTAPGNYLDGELTVGDSSKDQYINVVTGSGNAAGVCFQDTTGTSIVGGVRYTHSNNDLQLWTNGEENLRLTGAGNVGFGATALTLNAPNLLTVRNSSNGNEADVMLGNQTIRRGYVGINSSETRYFKCISYSSGNIFTGDIKMFINRGGGFNQTQAFRHYNCSIGGYNNNLYGFATDSGDASAGGVATIHLGSDECIYIKVANNLYGGDVFFTFEGSGTMTWVFNIGTYVTSQP